jgi:acyl carrier protein
MDKTDTTEERGTTEETAQEGLMVILREFFGEEVRWITPETRAADVPGWDSLQMVGIILAVQKRFGIILRGRDVDRLHCVGDFVVLIAQKRAG